MGTGVYSATRQNLFAHNSWYISIDFQLLITCNSNISETTFSEQKFEYI